MNVYLKINECKLIGSFMVNTFYKHFVEKPWSLNIEKPLIKLLQLKHCVAVLN